MRSYKWRVHHHQLRVVVFVHRWKRVYYRSVGQYYQGPELQDAESSPGPRGRVPDAPESVGGRQQSGVHVRPGVGPARGKHGQSGNTVRRVAQRPSLLSIRYTTACTWWLAVEVLACRVVTVVLPIFYRFFFLLFFFFFFFCMSLYFENHT